MRHHPVLIFLAFLFFSFSILSPTYLCHYYVMSCHYHCNSLSVTCTPLWEFVWIERFF